MLIHDKNKQFLEVGNLQHWTCYYILLIWLWSLIQWNLQLKSNFSDKRGYLVQITYKAMREIPYTNNSWEIKVTISSTCFKMFLSDCYSNLHPFHWNTMSVLLPSFHLPFFSPTSWGRLNMGQFLFSRFAAPVCLRYL